MGKKRKRAKDAAPPAAASASTSTAPPPSGGEDDEDHDDGPPAIEEVETAIYVVRYLAKRPELFQQRAFKELRAAMHPLVELQRQRYDPVDYVARVTAARGRLRRWRRHARRPLGFGNCGSWIR